MLPALPMSMRRGCLLPALLPAGTTLLGVLPSGHLCSGHMPGLRPQQLQIEPFKPWYSSKGQNTGSHRPFSGVALCLIDAWKI